MEVHVKRSVILMDRLGPVTLLTRKFPMFLSRLNEINGGCEKILPVSLSFWSSLKFFKMMLLAARLCGW